LFKGIDISASSLTAQRLRMDTISSNIANVETTRGENGEPYRRQIPVFREKLEAAALNNSSNNNSNFNNGVVVDAVIEDESPFRIEYRPEHPDSNEEGYLEESEEGDIYGMTAFYNNIHRIKFKKSEDESSERNKIIDMYYRNIKNNTFFMDKLLIISPDMRPPVVMGEEIKHDDLTQIYRKIVRQSNQVKGIGGLLYDSLTYNIQLELINMFDFIKNKVSKKSGIIREQMLGKRVDFSGLAVITPNPNIPPGTAGIPLRMVVGLFEPNLIYGILNSDYSDSIPQEFHDEVRKYLGHDVKDVSDEE